MNSTILSATLSRLCVDAHHQHLYLRWRQPSGAQCLIALPLTANGYSQVTLVRLDEITEHSQTLTRASKDQLLVVDCDNQLGRNRLNALRQPNSISLQSCTDILLANLGFSYDHHHHDNLADITIWGPKQLFASFCPDPALVLNHSMRTKTLQLPPQPPPTLTLQTNCPNVHIDAAKLMGISLSNGARRYTLAPC